MSCSPEGEIAPRPARFVRTTAAGIPSTRADHPGAHVAAPAVGAPAAIEGDREDGRLGVTPIANGTFLSGITRARHIANARAAGIDPFLVLNKCDLDGADALGARLEEIGKSAAPLGDE